MSRTRTNSKSRSICRDWFLNAIILVIHSSDIMSFTDTKQSGRGPTVTEPSTLEPAGCLSAWGATLCLIRSILFFSTSFDVVDSILRPLSHQDIDGRLYQQPECIVSIYMLSYYTKPSLSVLERQPNSTSPRASPSTWNAPLISCWDGFYQL